MLHVFLLFFFYLNEDCTFRLIIMTLCLGAQVLCNNSAAQVFHASTVARSPEWDGNWRPLHWWGLQASRLTCILTASSEGRGIVVGCSSSRVPCHGRVACDGGPTGVQSNWRGWSCWGQLEADGDGLDENFISLLLQLPTNVISLLARSQWWCDGFVAPDSTHPGLALGTILPGLIFHQSRPMCSSSASAECKLPSILPLRPRRWHVRYAPVAVEDVVMHILTLNAACKAAFQAAQSWHLSMYSCTAATATCPDDLLRPSVVDGLLL